MTPYSRAMTIARNTAAFWIAQMGNYALAFVTSVFTAVHLGPEHRGLLVAVLLANTLMVNFTNLGVQTCGMYFTGKSPARLARIHTTLVWIIIGITCLDFLIIGASGGLLRDTVLRRVPGLRELEWGYILVALAVLPCSLYSFAAQGIISGQGRVRALSRFLFHFGAVTNALNLIAVIMFPMDRPRLAHALIFIWVGLQVVAAFGAFIMLRASGSVWERMRIADFRNELKAMLSYGLRAFLGGFASGLVNRADHVFILSAIGTASIGVYNLSAKLAELVFHPSAAFETASYSRVASASREDAARLVQDLFRANWLVNVLMVCGLAAMARPLIHYVYHEEYVDAVAPLIYLLPGTVFMGGIRMLALFFSAQLGLPQIPSLIAWVVAGVHIPMLWWVLFRLHGGLGAAALVTSGSYGLMLVMMVILFARATGLVNPVEYLLPRKRDWVRLRRLMKREVIEE